MVIVAAVSLISGCGSRRSTSGETPAIESGVELFIAGDLRGAEATFMKVLASPASDEDLLTAHLYLGRIYLAQNEYQKAADVLSAGKALGGDIRFDEYFEEAARHIGASSSRIIQEEAISRGQLAALLNDMFGAAIDVGEGGGSGAAAQSDGESDHWASEYLRFAERAGIMTRLADGKFHPDEKVTRPAFVVVATRVSDRLGLERGVVYAAFPGGLRGAIASAENGPRSALFVSGREAAAVLGELSRAAGL